MKIEVLDTASTALASATPAHTACHEYLQVTDRCGRQTEDCDQANERRAQESFISAPYDI